MGENTAWEIDDVYFSEVEGLALRTGDLICTTDGDGTLHPGQFWRLIGMLIPGKVDHVAVYIGPGGRCVEAGGAGRVIAFEFSGGRWDAQAMYGQRKMVDEFYGAADPLAGRGFSEEERAIRIEAARYCLEQAGLSKPYNLNFLNSSTEDAFYCSQLAYLAYLKHGIDLNTGEGVPDIPGTDSIIFPQEIWESCEGKRVDQGRR